jgi:CubicO group peptidase (beta-lactamase class C family)
MGSTDHIIARGPSAGGLSRPRLERMHDVMAAHVRGGSMPGLVTLVSRRGDVHVDAVGMQTLGGSLPMQRDTIFRIASLTKPIAAAAAMILVEECRLRLDDPVDHCLPELAGRRVLARRDGSLHDTVTAHRSVTLRDLLTLRMGLGHIMAPCAEYPIRRALDELGLLLGPPAPQSLPEPDEWMRRVGTLPLIHQPGAKWMYDLGLDVLGVLVARVADQPLESFLRERLFEPLGMRDTGFHVPREKLRRLAGCYMSDPTAWALEVYDGVDDSQWAHPPQFASAAGGLVSTVDDYLAFCRMLLDKGRRGRERILSPASVELMTSDHLTDEQRAANHMFFGDHSGWGFGISVNLKRDDLARRPGRFGWDGGFGTTAYTDPAENAIGILMTQRMMDTPAPPAVFADFWTSMYQAIEE